MNMPITSIEVAALNVHDLAIEIADEACRVDIECFALSVPSDFSAPVYDTTALEPGHLNDAELQTADMEAIQRAVRYLDLRGLLVRPMPSQPQYVSFGRA
jgi:hypothetical protein